MPAGRCAKSASSFEQTGHSAVPIGHHASHCPHTMPISCCSLCKGLLAIPERATVLDVRSENGQAAGVFRASIAALALAVVASGCSKKGGPEQVADSFADAYFRLA